MDLKVNSDTFARVSDPRVSLSKRLAAYDLVFGMEFQLPTERERKWIVDVHGAAVMVHVGKRHPSRLGTAKPEQLLRLRPLENPFQKNPPHCRWRCSLVSWRRWKICAAEVSSGLN